MRNTDFPTDRDDASDDNDRSRAPVDTRLVNTELYPFTPETFRRNGLSQSYLDEGDPTAEPIVMVHGNPTWSFYYTNLILALRRKYRCIAPDHIGCGLSDKPTVDRYDYAVKSRVDDLEALLEHLGLRENITLVVHDWGGMIGMAYAHRHPGRIRRIIASNTGAFRLPPTKKLPLSLWIGRNTRFGEWLILQRNAFCRLAARWCVQQTRLPPAVREMYLAPYDRPEHRVAVLKFVQTIPLKPGDPGYEIVEAVENGLHRFRNVPTLLLWGLRDFVFDHHFLSEWQRHFPHATTHTWPHHGHYLLEDAKDGVIGKIRDFLAAHPLAPPPYRGD
ncbi:MAG: alpha/beta fold hydrolase [Gemmataceae bacterium]